MDIWTGYYAQMKKYKQLGLVPVSIAYKTPLWYDGETCFELAPPRMLLIKYKDKVITQEEYIKEYEEFLKNRVNWTNVIEKLYTISDNHDGKDLILCCFEKSSDFCHRHILSEYLTKRGLDVQEWIIK